MNNAADRQVSETPPSRSLEPAGLYLLAYARISDLSGKRGTSKCDSGVTNQQAVARSIARREGGVVVKQYTDNDRSASRDQHRPAFEAMLIDLYRGHTADGLPVRGVVTVDDDRIYKTPAQWERFVTAFRSAPGRVFADERGRHNLYGDEAAARGRRSTAVAMGENQRRRDRTRRWHAGQARRGVAHTGGRTFGYRGVQGAPGEIEVVAEQAEVIRAAVQACVAGQTWSSITAIFQRSGIPTENGGPWRVQTVKQIISSPRIAGLRMLGGEIVTDEDGAPVHGRWEPIVSPAEWKAVRQRYSPRLRLPGGYAKDPKSAPTRKYLLSGLLRCGRDIGGRRCEAVLAGCATKVGQSKYRYACRPKTDGGCGGCAVSGEWIDRQISDLVLANIVSACDGVGRWERECELEAISAKRFALETRWRRGEVAEVDFYRDSTVLIEILEGLCEEKARWEAARAVYADNDAIRRRRWALPPEEGGYGLEEKRRAVFGELSAVLIFPVGKGTKKRSVDSYRPVFRSNDRVVR